MPLLTCWFVKTSLVYFVLALIAGLLLAMGSVSNTLSIAGLFPIYIHLLVFGWLTQLIFGIVFWMFPKYSREKPRVSEPLGWATYGLLNLGLLLRAIGEPFNAHQPNSVWGWALVASAALQWLAGMAFIVNTWNRVKEK